MLHLSIGEEAPAVGVAEAMQPKDSFTTHHRGHGIFSLVVRTQKNAR